MPREDDFGQHRPFGRTLAAVLSAVSFSALVAGSALAQDAGPDAGQSFGLRSPANAGIPDLAPPGQSAPLSRPADFSAGAAAAPDPASPINYGKPRRLQKMPKPNPPPKTIRPTLPPLEPYRTSAQARSEKRQQRRTLPDPDALVAVPPPTVAAVATLPVKPRPRPDADPYAAPGIGIGNLRLHPFVESGLGMDSNPNKVETPQKGSAFWRGDAGLGLQSDWDRHSLTGSLRLGYSDFFNVPAANRPDGAGAVAARIDVTRNTKIDIGGSFALDTLRAGSPELQPGSTSATSTNRPIIWTIGGYGGVTQTFNRLDVSLRGSVDRSQYGDAHFSDGSVQYLSQNDFTTIGLRPRLAYEVSPEFKPFVEATVDRRVYDNTYDVNGYRRSSQGLLLRGGADFEVTKTLTGEVSGGLIQREYDDARLAPLRGPAADASLIWAATPLTNVTLRGATTANETTIANVSGSISRSISAEIAHSLFRNVLLTGAAAYQVNSYQGVDPSLSSTGALAEHIVSASVKAEYNLTRSVVVKASYTFEKLKSTVPGSDYTSNIFLLGLRLQR